MVHLKRKQDFELLYDMDKKLDNIAETLSVTCERVGKHEETIKINSKRITVLEKIIWTAIGGSSVIIFLVKVMKW